MPPARIKLADSVYLNVIETEKFKTNFISAEFFIPLRAETAAKAALLPSVLLRGTEKYPDMAALNKMFDYLYGSHISPRNYKLGETHVIGFSSYVLADKYALEPTPVLSQLLGVLEEVIFNPVTDGGVFSADYVETEKRNLCDRIKSQINNKNYYAVKRCRDEMCRGEAYAVSELGEVDDVMAITPESLYEFYKWLITSTRVELYFVGSTDTAALTSQLQDMFGRCANTTAPELSTQVIRSAEKSKEVIEDQPVKQGKLSLGFRTGCTLSDRDYHVFAMFRELYGGSPSSKLFMNVRERLSLCYYCSAIAEAHKGIMIVSSGIEVSNKQKAQDEILRQLELTKAGEITEAELVAARNSLINGYRELYDDANSLKSWYTSRMLAGRDDSPEDAAAALQTVTAADIAEMAKRVTLDTVYFLNGTLKPDEGSDEQ
ncbi:MAG: EF-P 5-aminopentanol modification-associated protein YfmF [Eubacteriales bacterium]|jgi:predicted Zn-dependent peptidase|nr:insulinase family protein [Clostridiales bacterium]